MKSKIIAIAGIAVSGLLFSASSMAEGQGGERPQGGPPSFESMDADGNGLLSESELKGPLLDGFNEFDSNGDGYLSEDEMPEPPERGGQGGGQGGGQSRS